MTVKYSAGLDEEEEQVGPVAHGQAVPTLQPHHSLAVHGYQSVADPARPGVRGPLPASAERDHPGRAVLGAEGEPAAGVVPGERADRTAAGRRISASSASAKRTARIMPSW